MKKSSWLPVAGFVLLGATLAGAYPIVLLEDNFDDKTEVPGSLLGDANKTPQVGTLWSSTVPTNNVWVQNEVAKDGNALQLTRYWDTTGGPAETGAWSLASADLISTASANHIEANTVVTLSTDITRLDIFGTYAVRLSMGGIGITHSPMVYLTANGDWRGWDYVSNTYVNSEYLAGTGTWNTVEIVLKWGDLNANNTVQGAYDVYLTREAGGSVSELERTLILEDLRINTNIFTEAMSYRVNVVADTYFGSTNYASTVYVDNVSLSVIPEPTVLLLLTAGMGGVFLFRRRSP